jgi:hypothetical protein
VPVARYKPVYQKHNGKNKFFDLAIAIDHLKEPVYQKHNGKNKSEASSLNIDREKHLQLKLPHHAPLRDRFFVRPIGKRVRLVSRKGGNGVDVGTLASPRGEALSPTHVDATKRIERAHSSAENDLFQAGWWTTSMKVS